MGRNRKPGPPVGSNDLLFCRFGRLVAGRPHRRHPGRLAPEDVVPIPVGLLDQIPFLGPIGAAKIGLIDDRLVVNPTIAQVKQSRLELVVAGTRDAVMMVESEAHELPEATMLEAVMLGHRSFQPVIDLIIEKMPVSISLGLWTTLITYLVSIPLGIRKAVRDGSRFDVWTSGVIIVGYAIPSFLLAILLIVLFAGGSYLQIFPLRGLVSDNWQPLSWPMRIVDYLWHITLPLLRPALLLVLVTQFIAHMQVFGQPYILTQGGPGYASYPLILYLYQTAWRYYHMGYAASMAIALAVFMLIVSLLQFRLLGERVEY